jgi:hypothetical protein
MPPKPLPAVLSSAADIPINVLALIKPETYVGHLVPLLPIVVEIVAEIAVEVVGPDAESVVEHKA